jgi:hypothetical protein
MSFGKYVSMVAGVKIKYYMKVSVKRKIMVTEMSKIEKLGSAQQLPLVIVAISE